MTYQNVHEGVFLSRPNRFIAEVRLNGGAVRCHVKNTGRCRELLLPGATVYLNRPGTQGRSTEYDLVAVRKGARLINMDSQAPNKVFAEYLQAGRYIDGVDFIKAEAKYGSSRFDFYVEAGARKIFIEIKGVTLEEDGVVLFPDAPTLRGVRHINELAHCMGEGYEAHVVFIVQMRDVRYFTPNNKTHPAFGAALSAAAGAGVRIAAFDCDVAPDRMEIRAALPVTLNISK